MRLISYIGLLRTITCDSELDAEATAKRMRSGFSLKTLAATVVE